MFKLAHVPLLDHAIHILAVVLERHRQVLFDADRLVVNGLSRHGEIIPLFPLLRYSSVDWLATSPFAFAKNSANGIDPWSPLPLVRTLTASAASSLSPKTRM